MRKTTRHIFTGFLVLLICAVATQIIVFIKTANREKHFPDLKYIINTIGCQIPRTAIFPEYYKLNWRLEIVPNCSYENILSTLTDDQTIVLNPDYKNSNCCIHEVIRVKNDDNSYNMSACESIETVTNVSGKEVLVTKCRNKLNFHANLPITSRVQAKLDHWRNVHTKDMPPSVIIFGIDTTSRSHAHRGLPKTLALMKELRFIDFSGYHSIAAGTFSNFCAFLMGLRKKEAMTNCAPKWESSYDTCPFIWKEFAQQKYVTMYVEDGHQTFNWGGQGGFRKRPTDYYIHMLFQSIEALREKYSPIMKNEEELACTSKETVPQFVFQYTKRFANKFKDVPFFSFTWLGNPFHDNQFTLGTVDEEISFIHHLNSLQNFLERTLVIFLSDHGDRYSFFQTRSSEAYIERGLPVFLMRIPEILKSQFPDSEEALISNSKSLTSGFDIHHTLKHILSLRHKRANFKPVLSDRSSLFIPVDLNRTCDKINVYSDDCVCGSGAFGKPLRNPFLLSKIMEYVVERLNEKISLEYQYVCHRLNAKSDNILSNQILKKTDSYTDALIQFGTIKLNATFEVKIKVFHNESSFGGCELIGDFQRVSAYGNQSACVKINSDRDKKMREFCVCKPTPKRKRRKRRRKPKNRQQT